MRTMEEHEKFHFPDGSSVHSVDGLRDKIETISYDVFYHHVTNEKNDFAEWVRHVLKDTQLADDLTGATSIVETVEVLNDYLHPKPAQDHLDKLDDIQSRIEHDVLAIKKFDEANSPNEPSQEWSSEAPEAPPVEENSFAESLQSDPESSEPVSTQDVDDIENFNQSDLEAPELYEVPSDQPSTEEIEKKINSQFSKHYKRQETERDEIEKFHHDVGTLIIKDFIWGFIFGVLVGAFLMRFLML